LKTNNALEQAGAKQSSYGAVARQLTQVCVGALLAAGIAGERDCASACAAKESRDDQRRRRAGDLALTQGAIEAYQAKHPELVSKVTFSKAPAPELPAKLKAMQAAGRTDIDLVLTGVGALSAGVDQGLWVKVLPDYAAKFPNVLDNYLPAARKMNDLAQNQALVVTFMPAGPLLEYNPAKVKQVPTTPQELLAWCKANPNRFGYARPANSGPGFTFIMGLPYILGDKDPRDPAKGWDKTWAYLKELDSCIEYYTTGTAAIMKELGEGSRDMTVTMTGWI
jgi:putative spermidine/putrescine transport system substrate-binding protein